jgi:DNA-binding NarL/FixJ family response regulator
MREMGVFSAREEQILQLLLVGFSTRKIAHDVDITVATVKADMRQIFRKVKARSETLGSIDAKPLAARQIR